MDMFMYIYFRTYVEIIQNKHAPFQAMVIAVLFRLQELL